MDSLAAETDMHAAHETSGRERACAAALAAAIALIAAVTVSGASGRLHGLARVDVGLAAAAATELLLTATVLLTLYRALRVRSIAVLATGYFAAALVGEARAFAAPRIGSWYGLELGIMLACATLGFADATASHIRLPRAVRNLRVAVPTALGATCAIVAATAIAGRWLPVLVQAGRPTPLLFEALGPLVTLGLVAALAALAAATRLRSRLSLWLAIVLEAAVFAIPLGLANGESSLGSIVALAETIVAGGAFLWALYDEHARTLRRYANGNARIRALCLAATTRPAATDQIAALLELAVRDLRYDGAALCTLEGHEFMIVQRAGSRVEAVGARLRVVPQLVRRATMGELVIAESAPGAPGVLVLVPLGIGSTVSGALALVTRVTRQRWAAGADLDFVSLLGAFAASAFARIVREERLDDLAFSDALTGLSNRIALHERIESARADMRLQGRRFAVHFLDLDGFKAVNDRYGHATGDRILQLVAERLSRAARATDTVARLGGDEFVILQRDAGESSARGFASRILETFRERFEVAGDLHPIFTSVGVAIARDPGESTTDLLGRADAALYRVKRGGRRGVAFADVRHEPVALAKR